MKLCTSKKCTINHPQSLTEFRKEHRNKDGLRSHCKTCDRIASRENASNNRQRRNDYAKKYAKTNKEKLVRKQTTRYRKNLEENRRKGRESRKKYYARNKSVIIEKARIYQNKRIKAEPAYRVLCNLRRRLNHVIKDGYKSATTLELLGCTAIELVVHLEKQFTSEMKWANYGSFWHIDHIKPLSKFNLLLKEEQMKACHYTNLQPLPAEDNIRKSNSYQELESRDKEPVR